MLKIGLTGGFGSGKTTVARILARLGAKVLDADKIAGRLLKPSGACFKPVVRQFGKAILTRGQINRKKLARVVFNNRVKKRVLEKIIHPNVRKEMCATFKKGTKNKRTKAIVIDVPLLFESGFHRLVDVTMVVKASQKQQIERGVKRMGITPSEAKKRIAAQWPLRKKISLADYVIDNRGTLTNTRNQVVRAWSHILNREHLTKKERT